MSEASARGPDGLDDLGIVSRNMAPVGALKAEEVPWETTRLF